MGLYKNFNQKTYEEKINFQSEKFKEDLIILQNENINLKGNLKESQ